MIVPKDAGNLQKEKKIKIVSSKPKIISKEHAECVRKIKKWNDTLFVNKICHVALYCRECFYSYHTKEIIDKYM